jgi:anti-sigma factor RsiW
MECPKFEELGLLYVSGELDGDEASQYEAHLNVCPECKRETEAYKADRASLFGIGTLGEAPSEAVDREILRVCSAPKKQFAASFAPLMWVRKYAAIPVFAMLLAVAVGGYYRYHSMTADTMRAKLSTEAATPESAQYNNDLPPVIDYSEIVKADSGAEKNTASKTLGNAEVGVPVSGNK